MGIFQLYFNVRGILWYMLAILDKPPSDCVGCVGMANHNILILNSTNPTLAKQLLLSKTAENLRKSQVIGHLKSQGLNQVSRTAAVSISLLWTILSLFS